jgi:adenylate cyclase class 2
MKNEIEATFLAVDKEAIRTKLKRSGHVLKAPEYLMKRKTFDFPNVPQGQKKWGRVRQESDKITMTVKEVRGKGINDTYESEVVVSDFDRACGLFEACEIVPVALQENLREVWAKDDIEITIDTWPGLKPFVEIEGSSEEAVCEKAESLDLDFKKAVFGSIDLVYEKELGIPSASIIRLPEISFKNPPTRDAA